LKQRLLIENVTKNFGGLRALDAVSLSLKQGEIVGLIGPNGSGKSTLINVICGFYLPSNGRIYMDDTDLTTWPAHQIARHGIGRTFQSIQLFSNLTVFENVMAGANIRATELDNQTPEKWAQHLINQFGLDEYADRLAATLPYGPQRSLEIARAVAIQCRFLLLDEPAAGMIRRESDQLIDVLRKIRADFGIGLLVIDHDLKMIMQLCDRVMVLNKGQIIASGSPEQVQQNPDVVEAYIGRKH
jgi:branched-chain amino acid transport system permease protein